MDAGPSAGAAARSLSPGEAGWAPGGAGGAARLQGLGQVGRWAGVTMSQCHSAALGNRGSRSRMPQSTHLPRFCHFFCHFAFLVISLPCKHGAASPELRHQWGYPLPAPLLCSVPRGSEADSALCHVLLPNPDLTWRPLCPHGLICTMVAPPWKATVVSLLWRGAGAHMD